MLTPLSTSAMGATWSAAAPDATRRAKAPSAERGNDLIAKSLILYDRHSPGRRPPEYPSRFARAQPPPLRRLFYRQQGVAPARSELSIAHALYFRADEHAGRAAGAGAALRPIIFRLQTWANAYQGCWAAYPFVAPTINRPRSSFQEA